MSKTIVDALNNYCEKLTGERPDARTIRSALKAITEANGNAFSRLSIVDLIDYFCECSGGGAQNVVFGEVSGEMETTAIGFAAYVTEIVIPEGVTSLKKYMSETNAPSWVFDEGIFSDFPNLKKITLPASLGTVPSAVLGGTESYTGCQDLEVVLADGITAIGDWAFEANHLAKITIPDSVVSIGRMAFGNLSGLKDIEIPSSVTSIGDTAFSYSSCIEKIIIHKPENSIEGAPWDAPNAEVIWTG